MQAKKLSSQILSEQEFEIKLGSLLHIIYNNNKSNAFSS